MSGTGPGGAGSGGARTLFVTATDTGVGKTFVACAVALSLRARGGDVGVMKPVATGCARLAGEGGVERLESDDAVRLIDAAGTDDPMKLVNPVVYEPPLAPTAAARPPAGGRMAGEEVDRDRILAAFAELRASHEFLLVEGIGGLLVPLVPSAAEGEAPYTVRDLAREMAAPVLVVSRDGLGTINHTALTVEAARGAGLDVKGIVLNRTPGVEADLSTGTNADEIEALTGVPVVARLGPLEGPGEAARAFTDETLDALFGRRRP